uniref:Uncharacterized protein n=1 Tax=Glossina austeni TaxID=7395 RepID=A0A1A9VLQ4_GLOAU
MYIELNILLTGLRVKTAMKFWITFTLLFISARSAFAILGVLGGPGIGLNVGLGGGIGLGYPESAHVPRVRCHNSGNCGRRRGNYHADYGMPRNDPGSYGAGMGADGRRNWGMPGNHGNGRRRGNYYADYGMPRNDPGSYGAGMGADGRRNLGMPGNHGNGRRRGNYHADYGMPRNDPGSYGVGMGADGRRNLGMPGNHGNYEGGVERNDHGDDMRHNSGNPGNYAASYGGDISPNDHGDDERDSPRMRKYPADWGPQSSGGPNKYRHNYSIKHNYAIEGNETLDGGNEIDFHKDSELETSHTTNDSNLSGHSNLAAVSGHGAGFPRCRNAEECAGASGAPRSVEDNVFGTMPATFGEGAAPGSLGPSGLRSLQGEVGAVAPLFQRK